jgi:hypothetical protein
MTVLPKKSIGSDDSEVASTLTPCTASSTPSSTTTSGEIVDEPLSEMCQLEPQSAALPAVPLCGVAQSGTDACAPEETFAFAPPQRTRPLDADNSAVL